MNRHNTLGISVLAALLAWLLAAPVVAATIADDLKAELEGRGPNELVPVIIGFANRVDLAQYRSRGQRERLVRALRHKAELTQGYVARKLAIRGARNLRQLWLSNSLAAAVPARLIPQLEALSGVESIRPDAAVQFPATPQEAAAAPLPQSAAVDAAPWNLDAVGAPQLWALGIDGSGTVVASLDTGVDYRHPDLEGNWRGGGNSWFDPNGEHATPYDVTGHGTQAMGLMVGGRAGGSPIGIAPGARWIAAKIFDDTGSAAYSAIHRAFQWVLDPDGNPATDDAPDVVNNSWGLAAAGACSLEFATDIEVLRAAGISLTFAGGNYGPSPASSVSPANNGGSVGVGAVDRAGRLAGYSSRGPSACDGSSYPRLTAPGSNVKTATRLLDGHSRYAVVSGTSFAAPHVAGALALLTQAFPDAGGDALEQALGDAARHVGGVAESGYGAVDLAAAYAALKAPPPRPAQVAAAIADMAAPDTAAGERIYREGRLPSGKALRAASVGGMLLPASRAACINCHRSSGMGGIEGQTLVPPVIRSTLYRPGWEATHFFGNSVARMARRPAYDDRSLARAIRHSVDAGGRPIAAPMPHYELDDADMASLLAYLKTLGAGTTPGVDAREIHFATVLTDGVPAAKRRAMEEVLQAYFDDRNAGSRTVSRQDDSGNWVQRPRRQWRLHVWELSGAPQDWPRQLAAHYRRQPVFAALGGLAAGSWQPIHEFCEKTRLPCFFPSTDLPPAAADGAYSLYLSRGVRLEAEALALELEPARLAGPVIQVFGGDAKGAAAAAAFREALARRGLPLPQDRRIDAPPDAAFWEGLLRGAEGVSLVVWRDRADLVQLVPWADKLRRVAVSSTLLEGLPEVPAALDGKVAAVHPFVLPEQTEPRLSRLRAWLSEKGMATDEERVRADAYFAAAVATTALMGIGEYFSREHFLERIEDLPEDAVPASLHPRISLGAGQRFAAKGAYVLSLSAGGRRPTAAGWFVP
ncbi:MAG: S8 family serine peptidase [Rhodocyclales bacterium]|nr:S8 family serine peptidase [Rhodocyclales bacterium]